MPPDFVDLGVTCRVGSKFICEVPEGAKVTQFGTMTIMTAPGQTVKYLTDDGWQELPWADL